MNCQCQAYTFPHREFSGKCDGRYVTTEYVADTMNAEDKIELYLFNKAESDTINAERAK